MNMEELKVMNNEERNRYELRLGSDYAYVDYQSGSQALELLYIFVPPSFRGKGIAEELIKYVLDDAAKNNRKINVYCSWIAGYVRSHAEYHSLLR